MKREIAPFTGFIAVMLWLVFLMFLLGGCATTSGDTVAKIQQSCDDDKQTQTVINGHAYFCMDFDSFQQKMQAIGKVLQQRGL